MVSFYGVFLLLIVQRLSELYIARRNLNWILSQGGLEVGAEHYPLMVGMHTAFFISLAAETMWRSYPLSPAWAIILPVLLAVQALRYWALSSLGPFWNTRIVYIPGSKIVKKGPYRFLRHPNYLAVICEVALIPLLFKAYATFFVFGLLNSLMLGYRIRMEERALASFTSYQVDMESVTRFVPGRSKL